MSKDEMIYDLVKSAFSQNAMMADDVMDVVIKNAEKLADKLITKIGDIEPSDKYVAENTATISISGNSSYLSNNPSKFIKDTFDKFHVVGDALDASEKNDDESDSVDITNNATKEEIPDSKLNNKYNPDIDTQTSNAVEFYADQTSANLLTDTDVRIYRGMNAILKDIQRIFDEEHIPIDIYSDLDYMKTSIDDARSVEFKYINTYGVPVRISLPYQKSVSLYSGVEKFIKFCQRYNLLTKADRHVI